MIMRRALRLLTSAPKDQEGQSVPERRVGGTLRDLR